MTPDETPGDPPVLIFDLDGTVLSVNSFPRWVAFMLRGRMVPRFGPRRLLAALRVAWLLARRKTGLIDHEAFKWQLQRTWQHCTRDDRGTAADRFIATLQPYIRPGLRALLDRVRTGQSDAVLATAAAGDYAIGLGASLGFAHILATAPARLPAGQSNVGTRKCESVLHFLAEQGWQDRARILFTDHEDDLPLMAICPTVYWFGTPAEATRVKSLLPALDLRPGASAPTGPRQGWGALRTPPSLPTRKTPWRSQ